MPHPQDKPPTGGPRDPVTAVAVTDRVPVGAGAGSITAETLRQALAELEDTKGRLRRDSEREFERVRGHVLEALLPVLDNLERTLHAAVSSLDPQSLLDGIKLVHAQFLRALQPFGLERVSAVGARFDPKLHEALATVPVTDPNLHGVVIAESAPGYRVAGRIVRPAKVQVGRTVSVSTGQPSGRIGP